MISIYFFDYDYYWEEEDVSQIFVGSFAFTCIITPYSAIGFKFAFAGSRL